MTKVKTGRPKIDIDWGVFDSLCEIQCTQEEISKVLAVSVRTLQRRCKDERGETFDSLYKKGSLGGQHSVRRAQFRMAHEVPVMAIWWGSCSGHGLVECSRSSPGRMFGSLSALSASSW